MTGPIGCPICALNAANASTSLAYVAGAILGAQDGPQVLMTRACGPHLTEIKMHVALIHALVPSNDAGPTPP